MNSEIIGVSLTIVATIISIYNTILFLRQSKLLEKQTLLQRGQIYPLIKIENANIEENMVKIDLKNMTEVAAFQLGLRVSFMPCSPGDGHWNFIDDIIWTGNSEMKKGHPRRCVIPLLNNKGLARLYRNENDSYEAEVVFLFKGSDKEIFAPSKYDKFEELKIRLLSHNIRYVAVLLSLVYKDIQDTVEEFEPITDFIVDIQKHKNLEEAWKDHIPFHDKTIGYEQIPFMDYEFYKKGKSYRGRLEST